MKFGVTDATRLTLPVKNGAVAGAITICKPYGERRSKTRKKSRKPSRFWTAIVHENGPHVLGGMIDRDTDNGMEHELTHCH